MIIFIKVNRLLKTIKESTDFDKIIYSVGNTIKDLRIKAGYNSYEVFAWENGLSRIQYWKMEKGINCILKSLHKVLKIHNLTYLEFFDLLEDK